MKFNYKLTRQCGTSHGPKSSGLLFNSSGTIILSPTFNRIQTVDLQSHSTRTLPFEARSNIRTIALSPDDRLLIVVDENNYALLVNFHRGVVLHRFHFKKTARIVQFSPNGLYFAVSYGKHVQVWHSPSLRRTFAPLVLHRTYTGLYAEISSIVWSEDGTILMAASQDNTARLWTLHSIKDFIPITFSGHKTPLVGAYFGTSPSRGGLETLGRKTTLNAELDTIYTISEDGSLYNWKFNLNENPQDHPMSKEETNALDFFTGNKTTTNNDTLKNIDQAHQLNRGQWTRKSKHFFSQPRAKITCTAFSAKHSLLVIAYSSGNFSLYELPSCDNIHTLTLSSHPIQSLCINSTAEWLAFGVPQSNQLLVWEWRSESYILKQQGHGYGMRCMAYSPDGVCIATGGEDGKIKLWNSTSGFSFVTLPSHHTAPVTSVCFAKSTVLLSAGLDGVIKAHDLMRYRHFRTFTSPTPVQFVSLDVDNSGEIVVAGSNDPFQIFVWNLQTGKILDILSGHKGPVVQVQFHPLRGMLASASWDGTLRVWDLFTEKKTQGGESIEHSSEVICMAWRPDGKHICTGILSGLLQFWEVENMTLMGEIDGQKDIAGGRKMNDRMTADNNDSSRYFTSICYSADGSCILAGGNSKYICIYEVSQQILLKKFQVTFNRSLDGVLNELHSKHLGDGGPINHEDTDEYDANLHLPGAKRLDDGSRKSLQEVLTIQVAFSATGREFSTISTEGLHIYSLDEDMIFDPIGLTESITPSAVIKHLKSNEYGTALRMSMHLNEISIVHQVLETTPHSSIPLVVKGIGPEQLDRLMQFISKCVATSPHIEFYMEWSLQVLLQHGIFLQKHRGKFMTSFRAMFKAISTRFEELKNMCDENSFTLQFVEEQGRLVMGAIGTTEI